MAQVQDVCFWNRRCGSQISIRPNLLHVISNLPSLQTWCVGSSANCRDGHRSLLTRESVLD